MTQYKHELPKYTKTSFFTRLIWLGRSGKTYGERIKDFSMVNYQPTAIGYENLIGKAHSRKVHQGRNTHVLRHSLLSVGGQILENNTRCHEYLAMDDTAEAIDDQKILLENSRSYVRHNIDELTDILVGNKPSTIKFPSALKIPSIWFQFLRITTGLMSIVIYGFMLGLGGLFDLIFNSIDRAFDNALFIFENPVFFYCFALMPLYWAILKILTHVGFTDIFDPDFLPGSALRRDLGTLRSVSKKKGIIEIPFEELEARTTTMWDGGNRAMCKLYLAHKYSKLGVVCGIPYQQAWYVGVLWEYYQHFMDVSRPLPDVPEFEPFRHLDPTTLQWDKDHNRPRWVWRDMSKEDYRKLVEASEEAARTYPYLNPAAVEDENWKPAGDGKHWYQLG
ncbi:hypothetical protein KO489_00390 [Reinekea forsetii]|nr:hypothetical protein [Reinekea forsetii]